MAKKSWTERLLDPKPHEVKPAPVSIAGMKKGEIMTPRMIEAFIRSIPRGTSVDLAALRQSLPTRHGAAVTCPITTGFHLRTVAEAAFEAHQRGVSLDEITPFWRVLDARAATTKKLSFGADLIATRRRLEGLI